MSHQHTLPGFYEALVRTSIETVQHYVPEDGAYHGCFSGGKDSVVLKEIVRLAGVPVDWHYNVTTIDPPELVAFMREYHPDVIWDRPKTPFFKRMAENAFPTRRMRWCCKEYKEHGTPVGKRMLLGIRAAESPRRAANWQTFTYHRRSKEYAVLPILHWKKQDVWRFIRERHLPYCTLYDEGFDRLGCVGCPMARRAGREREFQRWPNFERAWKKAFQRLWQRRTGSLQRGGRIWFGNAYFDSWEQMWEWWLSDESLPTKDECDGGLFTFEDEVSEPPQDSA